MTSDRNPRHKACDSPHCSNNSKKGKRFCVTCEDINARDERRAKVYAGETVSREDWETVAEEDMADAAFEAYKWALRDGLDDHAANEIAERAADEVERLFRKARKAKDPQGREDALALIAISNETRRVGQAAAAAMIGRAAHAVGMARTSSSERSARSSPQQPSFTPVEECGALTQSGKPCRHPAPRKGQKCASNHIPVNYKTERITLSTLKQRGWTEAMIRDVLGDPDALAPNPHYSKGAPMKLYTLQRVVEVESSEDYRVAKEKADRRRVAARKGQATAQTMKEAREVVAAEGARIGQELKEADRLANIAVASDARLSLRARIERRDRSNEIMERTGNPLCESCGWRHRQHNPCRVSPEDAHNEAQLVAQVEAVFSAASGVPELPPRTQERNTAPKRDHWTPEQSPDYYTRNAVRRMTGWSPDTITKRLGKPDQIIQNGQNVVHLFLKQRVEDSL